MLSGIENITAGSGNDVLIGDNNANSFFGGAGDNRLDGRGGNDHLEAAAGADTFVYDGQGQDVVENFAKSDGDHIEITFAPAGVSSVHDLVSHAHQVGIDTVIDFGGGKTLTLLGVNSTTLDDGDFVWNPPIKGTAGNDTINGDPLYNNIDGLAGNDIIEGFGGGDTMTGGAGIDTLSYEHSGAGVSVTLVAGQAALTSGGDADGDVATLFENIKGSSHDDTLTGDSGANVIDGGAGNDTINGGAGNDTLMGGAGNDMLIGGGGTDTADFSYLINSEFTVTLDASGNGTTSGFANDIDTLSSIVNLTGGGENDHFTGSTNANVFVGADGDDHLTSGGGKDILDGGAGSDTADFTGVTTGLTIALKDNGALTTVTGGGTSNGTQLIGIEHLVGSDGNDTLTGNSGVNSINGGAGDDTIVATAGRDIYDGDLFSGNISNNDTLTFASFKTDVSVDLTGTFNNGSTVINSVTSLYSITHFENLIGGSGNDTLIGNASDPTKILAGAGNDIVRGGSGADQLDGGAGTDTLDLSTDTSTGMFISLDRQYTVTAAGVFNTTATSMTGTGGLADGDKFANFENIIGGSGDDTLIGSTATANILEGGAGNDTLIGLGSNDTVSYAHDSAGVTIDLNHQGSGSFSGTSFSIALHPSAQTGGDAAGDMLFGFANIIGGSGDDHLTGDAGNNVINGGAGDDFLEGGKGSDTLLGGAGDDEIQLGIDHSSDASGSGGDTVDGGDGRDLVSYGVGDHSLAGVTITLGTNGTLTGFSASGGDAVGDKLTNVEDISGTWLNDKLTGNNLDNELSGGGSGDDILSGMAGDDTLLGVSGNDTLIGGVGNDILDGGADTDAVNYSASALGVTVDLSQQGTYAMNGDRNNDAVAQHGGDAEGDMLWGIENIVGSNLADTLTGDLHDNNINGGLGNDIIEGGAGNDTLTGGGGIDTLSYLHASGDVFVTLHTGAIATASGSDAQGDMATGFVNLIGGIGNDTLDGSHDIAANIIDGGGLGNDTLIGGIGDTVSFAHRSVGVTVELDGANQATVGGGASGDHISGFANIIGSSGGDQLTGDAGNNVIDGGDGTDTLTGGAGNDMLLGGGGNDVFMAGGAGGAGIDSYDGGSGDLDEVDYSGETVGFTVTLGLDGKAAKVTGGAGSNAAGDTLANIDYIVGSAGNDMIVGGNVTHNLERFDGGTGDDILKGGAGNSTLNGEAGNDKIFASTGSQENYSGGADIDTLTFETFKTGVSVTIGQSFVPGSAVGIDHLTVADDFEILIGGSGNDILAGDGTNAITINGGLGNDIIESGAGADTLMGGGGTDTLSYRHASGDVFVTLHTGAIATASGNDAQGDMATGFVNLIGGVGNDTLDGSHDTAANIIDGGGLGNDTLIGGIGDTVSFAQRQAGVFVTLNQTGEAIVGGGAAGDHITGFNSIIGSAFDDGLTGGLGNDTIFGGDGNDVLSGGLGINTVNGGDGTDVGSYQNGTFSVTVMLAAGSVVHSTARDTLQSVELVLGASNNDIYNATGFSGTSKNAGSVSVGDEDGSFNGFRGGGGDDSITGNGNTIVLYDDATAGVIVNLDTVAHSSAGGVGSDVLAQQAHGIGGDNGVGTDTFHNGIAQVEGSNFDDILIGGSANDVFYGLAGDDQIYGGAGSDTAGYNIIKSGDTALSDGDGISVNLATGDVTGLTSTATTLIGHDTLHSIESIIGSNADDTYVATAFGGSSTNAGSDGNSNQFEGMDGDDTVTGNGDTRVSYQHASAEVTVTLTHDGAGFSGNLLGSDAAKVGDDTFTGGVNAVRGSDFNDQITGNGEGDTLDGWLGNDTLTGDAGMDTFVYSIGTSGNTRGGGADVVTNFQLGIDKIDLTGVSTVHTLAQVTALMKDVGTDVVIDFHNGNTLTIDNVHKADLHTSDFVLH
jgi:Ca2+-binding RTX toxin-like protein